MLSHITLLAYYSQVFGLAQHHKYQISEIENLLPYERDIYYNMLLNFIEEQNQENG